MIPNPDFEDEEFEVWGWRFDTALGRGGREGFGGEERGGGWWKTGVRMLSRESRVWGLVGRRGAVKT